MYTKASILALCAAASVKQVVAGVAHVGHRHGHLHNRDIAYAETDTVVVTDWVTVTVDDEQPKATAPAVTAEAVAPAETTTTAKPATPSTTSVVEPTTPTTTAVAAPATTTTPVAKPTTMVTALKAVSSSSSDTTSAVQIQAIETTSSTSSSAAAVATTSASTSTASGGKRGAAYNEATLVEAILTLGGDVSWGYNWGSSSDGLTSKIAYYPMLWSSSSDHTADWESNANTAIGKGSTALLSFNEPDNAGQAHMSASEAASAHIQYMNPFAGKASIGSPAITSSTDDGQGLSWMTEFLDACAGNCKIDFCAGHWYGPGGSDGAQLFLTYVKDLHTTCENKPVWITEFAATSGDTDAFVSTVVEQLESDEFSFVEKYSYFMVSVDSLLSSATSLSSFGDIFFGLGS